MTYALAKKKGAREWERGNEWFSFPRSFRCEDFRRGRRRWTTQRGEIWARMRRATGDGWRRQRERDRRDAESARLRRSALARHRRSLSHARGSEHSVLGTRPRAIANPGTGGRDGTRDPCRDLDDSRRATRISGHVAGCVASALPGALVREHGLRKHLRAPALHTKKMACYEITSMTTMSSPVRLASLIDRVQSSALLAAAARVPLTFTTREIDTVIDTRETRRRDSYHLSWQLMISFLKIAHISYEDFRSIIKKGLRAI